MVRAISTTHKQYQGLNCKGPYLRGIIPFQLHVFVVHYLLNICIIEIDSFGSFSFYRDICLIGLIVALVFNSSTLSSILVIHSVWLSASSSGDCYCSLLYHCSLSMLRSIHLPKAFIVGFTWLSCLDRVSDGLKIESLMFSVFPWVSWLCDIMTALVTCICVNNTAQ